MWNCIALNVARQACCQVRYTIAEHTAATGVSMKTTTPNGPFNEAALSYYRLQAGESPPDGWFVVWTKGNGIFPFHTSAIDLMASKIGELQQAMDVYVGMALQKTAPEPGKRGTGANSAAIFGVWIEIDCREGVHKEKAENLPTKEQALGILKGLPVTPTVILNSGGGFHAHWWFNSPLVFTTDEELQKGQDLVRRFQQTVADVFRQQGFKVDTTSDLARVLRPPHTFNHKSGQPVLVTVVHYDEASRYPVATINAFCPATSLALTQVKKGAAPIPIPVTVAGQAPATYPPAALGLIMNGCAWLRHCRDDAASLPEPEWFAALSIVARCEDGNKHAHDISAPYPGYTHAATEAKIAHALSGGPRTCANIETNLNAASYCSPCPHRARASSPITLGLSLSGPQGAYVRVTAMIPDAPVSPQALIPANIIMSTQRGIELVKDDGNGGQQVVPIFPAPLIIIARFKLVHSDKEEVMVGWHTDGKWHSLTVDRKVIADTRDIVSLASFGLPITSQDKEFVVKFFREYDRANRDNIPLLSISNHMGWQSGQTAFLWGRHLISEAGVSIGGSVAQMIPAPTPGVDTVVFKGANEGDEQVADGLYHHGKLESWLSIANRAVVHPTPLVILLAACAPPLLHILGASNFVVETSGTTSTGKTTVLRLAASVWGCPDEREACSFLYSWDMTLVWLERVGAVLHGLPLILDDTKRVFASLPKDQARAMVSAVIYAYASGKGRGRGSIQGTQRTGAFRSVLISSGEQPCAESSTDHGGARARVLSLWGPPFGPGEQGQLVKDINMAVVENFGFAGPWMVFHLLRNRDKWPAWKAEYRQAVNHYANLATGDNVAGRLGEIFAALEVTAHRLLEALPGLTLARPARETLQGIWSVTVAGAARDADRALAALRDVWDWTAASPAKFFGRHRKDQTGSPVEPAGGWLGRWDDSPTFDHIAYLGKPLRDRLEGFGYDAAATIRTWADRGWLLKDSKGRNQRSTRIDEVGVKCYCVPRRVFEVELGLDLTPSSPPTPSSLLAVAPPNPFLVS